MTATATVIGVAIGAAIVTETEETGTGAGAEVEMILVAAIVAAAGTAEEMTEIGREMVAETETEIEAEMEEVETGELQANLASFSTLYGDIFGSDGHATAVASFSSTSGGTVYFTRNSGESQSAASSCFGK